MQKKYSINFLITVALVFFIGSFTLQAQKCNSELGVYKGRNARSATLNDATKFKMELTNNSSQTQTYEIRSVVFDEPCEETGFSDSTNSRNATGLDVSIQINNSRASSITVPPRTTKSFVAEVSISSATKFQVWKCVELKAVSEACAKGEARALLKVFISDPTNN